MVTQHVALLWTDGRYFLQAERELTGEWILMRQGEANVPDIKTWMKENLTPGSTLGIDPEIHSILEAKQREIRTLDPTLSFNPMTSSLRSRAINCIGRGRGEALLN